MNPSSRSVPLFLSRLIVRLILPLFSILLAPALVQAQWITGYYSSQNTVQSHSQIPWSKYTHIVHFSASTPGDGTVSMYYLTASEIAALRSARDAAGTGTKLLIAIKDNDNNLNAFPQSTAPGNIANFVNSIVNFVNTNGYDGVDLDWEKNINAAQFNDLLSRLRLAMPNKLITMAANPGNSGVAAASQAALDQVNVMCYDLDWGTSYAWHLGALRPAGNQNVFTCDWDVAYFTSAGLARSKIGVGMPFYGRRRPGATQVFDASSWSRAITLFYLKDLVNDTTRWQPQYRFYDNVYGGNYLSIPALGEFNTYTGPEFLRDAVAWGKAQGFGGYMTFTTEYEFLPTESGDARYPLSTVLHAEVFGGGGGGGTLPPANLTLPSISGVARQGEKLTAAAGTWSNSPASYQYQWQRCSSSCTAVAGATAPQYSLGPSDVGSSIRVAVTASNTAGSATASSAATAAVLPKGKGRVR